MSFTGDKLYGRQGGRVVPDTSDTDREYAAWKARAAAEAEAERGRAEDVQLDLFGDEPA